MKWFVQTGNKYKIYKQLFLKMKYLTSSFFGSEMYDIKSYCFSLKEYALY